MGNLPQAYPYQRPTRVRPAEFTPAVLRIEDGTCTPGELELFSLTGGLLSLPKPLDRGSRVKLMFLTATGPVLGVAEMLRPVSWKEQPFRFVVLHENDHRRLLEATQPAVEPDMVHAERTPATVEAPAALPKGLSTLNLAALNPAALNHGALNHPVLNPAAPEPSPQEREEQWIEKYRAAVTRSESPRARLPKILVAAITVVSIVLGVFYAFHAYLLR
jgi:hypothetical protein